MTHKSQSFKTLRYQKFLLKDVQAGKTLISSTGKEFLILILTHSRTLPVDIEKNILIMKNFVNFGLSQHFNLHLI